MRVHNTQNSLYSFSVSIS